MLSVMMFFQFFVWGGWYVTVGNYMAANGMTAEIAAAYSVGPIAAIISPFFLGLIADRFFAAQKVMAALHVLGGVALCFAPGIASGGNHLAFIGVLLVHMLCYMPTLGLSATIAFRAMTNQEKQFPIVRVFGTIGWIVANWIVSKWLHADTGAAQFYVAGGAAVLLGVFSLALPNTPPIHSGKAVSIRDILGLDSLELLKERSFLIFILSSFLICIPLSAYYAFAPVFTKAMAFQDPAFAMSFGQVTEILFMILMPLCFARLGVKAMLLLGMAAWVLRYAFFAGAASTGIAPLVVMGILLHGICYDFFFVTGQIYVDQKAPANVRAQAQGFLVLVTQGAGMLIGAQIAGQVVAVNTAGDYVQWGAVWGAASTASLVVFVLFLALFNEKKRALPAA